MSANTVPSTSTVEAVIISGPRKGEFVRVGADSVTAGPDVEAALDELIGLARQISANLVAATAEARALRDELRGEQGGARGAA